jgi:hypothetical protein
VVICEGMGGGGGGVERRNCRLARSKQKRSGSKSLAGQLGSNFGEKDTRPEAAASALPAFTTGESQPTMREDHCDAGTDLLSL